MSTTFTQTLNAITATKLQVLSKQQADFTAHKQKVLSSVAATNDSRERVRLLIDGIKSWRSADTTSTESSSGTSGSPYLNNVQTFLQQAEHDPSIGGSSISEWERKLIKSLETEAVKFEYAELFGRLLTEWVGGPAEKKVQKKKEIDTAIEAGTGQPAPSPLKKTGRKEMHEERAKFESYVVVPNDTDPTAIKAYLEELYSLSKESRNQLELVRKRMQDFGEKLLRSTFTVSDLEWTIKSLLSKDLLPNEQRATLNEFILNKAILKEVADVLNMHLASLSSWSWPAEGVAIEMRRYLNGKYRNFMEEELLQALFLHFLGVKWSVEFKNAFLAIFTSRAWKLSSTPLPKAAAERRKHFLSEDPASFADRELTGPITIEKKRRLMQREHFFMGQLPENEEVCDQPYDSDSKPLSSSKLNPVAIKQTLLYIMATECHLNMALHKSFTVIGSDFHSFGSSLSHSSLLTVFKFYGVSGDWLTFFEKFLSAPLKFTAEGPPQIRKRGVPMAHSLSDVLGEVLLFTMDFAVNQRADGLFLYRLFDDLWLWNSDPEVCAKAWAEMRKFADLVGLQFNGQKTGSVCVGQTGPSHPGLPQGPIKYGFLKFEPSGHFVIDQPQVDVHISELRIQLAACDNSVLAWVQVYNKYISAFLVTNLGSPPANCFGKSHIEMVIKTLEQIHRELFPQHNGSVTAYLADVIAARFSVREIPDGWYYWPISMGGLEVKNPFIPLYLLRDSICQDPSSAFAKLAEEDADRWAEKKEEWDTGTVDTDSRPTDWEPPVRSGRGGRSWVGTIRTVASWDDDATDRDQGYRAGDFMPFEEYILYRTQRFRNWKETYCMLLNEPNDCLVESTTEIEAVLKRVSAETGGLANVSNLRRTGVSWGDMDVYWQWVVACFGDGMIAKWGGLEVVRPGTLPVGMVDAWKSRRMRWDQ